MREIKFRIYDKKRKEWVHDTDHAVNLLGETIIMGEILRRPDDTNVKIEELNDLAVMQFTGLKDKNGVEIFEGDLFMDEEDGAYNFVEWDQCHGGWSTNEWFFGAEFVDNIQEMEIIGNIYDTSSPLKE